MIRRSRLGMVPSGGAERVGLGFVGSSSWKEHADGGLVSGGRGRASVQTRTDVQRSRRPASAANRGREAHLHGRQRPITRDLTPGGNSGLTTINLSDVDIRGEVYEDSGSWKMRVTAASTHTHWGQGNGERVRGQGNGTPNLEAMITRWNFEPIRLHEGVYQVRYNR